MGVSHGRQAVLRPFRREETDPGVGRFIAHKIMALAGLRDCIDAIRCCTVRNRPVLPVQVPGDLICGMTKNGWQGQLRIEGQTAWWSGSVGDTTPHRHFAAQAVFADVPIHLLDGGGVEQSATCLLIEPDAPHQLLRAHSADICYVEPTATAGLPEGLRARIARSDVRIVSAGAARPFWENAVERPARRKLDARVVQALSSIERLLPEGVVRLEDIYADSQLSLGRFRHLFSAEVGMPFQRYVLWCRLRTAFDELVAGLSITAAAHAAGFADAAHFARTTKAMFGIRAGDLNLKA